MDHLSIWQNVGDDVEYGSWAMLGARQGTYMTMLTDWDYTKVQWFDNLKEIWEGVDKEFDVDVFYDYGEKLNNQLDLPSVSFSPEQSKFFKQHYMSNWRNIGAIVKEIDVIRRAEGW
jgi:hypothetical protein